MGAEVQRALRAAVFGALLCALPVLAFAQTAVTVGGRITDASTGTPLSGALLLIEGTELSAVADSAGRYRITNAPAGRQVLRAQHLGYAVTRTAITIPLSGVLTRDVSLAVSALQLPGVIVTADPTGRARGEQGTASVIEREAIRHQTAASLAQILELIPGIQLQPPGLDQVQQISLRSSPISSLSSEGLGSSAAALASAGTLIVLDGVPLSNNANLQSLGPRGELSLSSSAGGGIDLRRIPATLIERVEVIRGVPSARYSDLTQGAIIVDTRAGEVEPELSVRLDRQTSEGSIVGGRALHGAHTGTALFDIARTWLAPGIRDDEAYRIAAQLAHRARFGEGDWLTFDTRVDHYQILQDSPEQPQVRTGSASRSRDSGLRVSERARLRLDGGTLLELTASVDHQKQRSFSQASVNRAAQPFTELLTEGRAVGHFIGGAYNGRADINGDPWLVFTRLEASQSRRALSFDHQLRAGLELRREWNSGPGYQFDIEFPPQVRFNGVQGFDRPRRYDAVPPVATSAFYIDDRFTRTLGAGMLFTAQAGLRFDVLHSGTSWLTGSRHTVAQPRLNLQLAPRPWLRLRAGAGRTAKYPTMAQLNPAPQYHDVVNVNWYANNPAERLAVLTTSILDPTNPALRQAVTNKLEAGFELDLGTGSALSVVAFDDRMRDAIGLRRTPRSILREHYQLSDSAQGTGRPPQLIEPATRADTVPVLLLEPANTLAMHTGGVEFTLTLPELRLHTRLEVQGAWVRTRLESEGIEVGSYFTDFQLTNRPRTPYWNGSTQTGEWVLLTYRIIHQQPAVGLVITTTIQHNLHEYTRNFAATDSLAFAGYIRRTGELVPLSANVRSSPEFRDLHLPRRTILTDAIRGQADWLLSLQVSKTLPLEGRLSFYAYNALDRIGTFGDPNTSRRLYPARRFGLDISFMAAALLR